MKVADLVHQADSLKERIREAYETDLDKVPLQEEIDINEVEFEISELKRKMKALGPVNLTALQEFDHYILLLLFQFWVNI